MKHVCFQPSPDHHPACLHADMQCHGVDRLELFAFGAELTLPADKPHGSSVEGAQRPSPQTLVGSRQVDRQTTARMTATGTGVTIGSAGGLKSVWGPRDGFMTLGGSPSAQAASCSRSGGDPEARRIPARNADHVAQKVGFCFRETGRISVALDSTSASVVENRLD